MSTVTIQPVAMGDRPRVIATLVSAFIGDPVERWLYPEPLAYLTEFAAFVAAFGGAAFESQTVWSVDEFAAVAIWLPPGAEADGEAIVAVLSESVAPDKHADTFAVLEQMDAAHPKDRHWYLVHVRAPALVPTCCGNVWPASTPITVRRSSKRPTRGRCRL